MANSAIQSAQFGVATESQRGVVNGTDARNLVFGGSALSFRNRVINGAMMVDQRFSGGPAISDGYLVDRWRSSTSQSSWFTVQQNQSAGTAPTGFTKYLGITSSGTNSVGTLNYLVVQQGIEGFNIADFDWGADAAAAGKSAKSITLSFWVRSSLTGSFSISIKNAMGGSATRTYLTTYVINVANTWEYKTITIPGCTDGVWDISNGCGISLNFGLGVGTDASLSSSTTNTWLSSNRLGVTGATSLVGTSGATWRITGVQLEAGSVATPFENRPIGVELVLCQRYYEKSYDFNVNPGATGVSGACSCIAQFNSGSTVRSFVVNGGRFTVQKRITPNTFKIYSTNTGTEGSINGYSSGTSYSGAAVNQLSASGFSWIATTNSPSTTEMSLFHWTAEAEL